MGVRNFDSPIGILITFRASSNVKRYVRYVRIVLLFLRGLMRGDMYTGIKNSDAPIKNIPSILSEEIFVTGVRNSDSPIDDALSFI